MNNNVDANKKFIREQIDPSEQKEFSTYFLSLPDHQQFDSWTIQRTIDVVAAFKNREGGSHHHKQTPPEPAEVPKGDSPVQLAAVEVKPSGQATNCINLLEQIEQKNAIRAGESNKKAEKDQSWLNISNFSQFLTNSDPTKFNNDLFKSFDTIISKPTETSSSKSPTRMSMPVISTKKQAQKKRKNQSSMDAQSLKSSIEKEGKNGNKDKLFKVKLCEKIACKKVEEGVQVKAITITHHEMIHRIFLPDYAMYFVQVRGASPEEAVVCKRTYDDFVQLRNTLQHLYPYVKTPFLENGSWLSENDIALIQKNKIHLQLFMRALLEHPLLARLPIVHSFLSIPDHKKLKAFLEGFDKAKPPRGLGEICSPDGCIGVELSSEQYELITELPRWQSIFSGYFQKYGDLLVCLAGQLEAVDQSFCQLQKLGTEMQGVLRQLSERNTQIERQEDFEAFFRRQEQYYAGMKQENEDQIVALTSTLIPLVKYERLNIAQFKPLFEDVQKLTEKYLRRMENEPESPCSTEEIPTIVAKNRLGDELWEESDNIQFFKLQLGYLHSSLLQETHLFSSRLIDTLARVWGQLYGQERNRLSRTERLSIKSCY